MAAPHQMLLLADIWELLGAFAALLVPILYGIKQMFDAAKQGPQGEDQLAPPPRQAANDIDPRQPAGGQADPLRSQVEEFLRRSGQAPQAGRERPVRRDIEVLVDEQSPPRAEPVPRPAATAPAAAAASPKAPPADLPKRPARRSVTPKIRKTLAERARERAADRASKTANRGPRLGQRIIEDDLQFDVQLKAKFDHTIGTLAGTAASTSQPAPAPQETPASQIAAMLASPSGIRQAIVVSEILNRPSDRW